MGRNTINKCIEWLEWRIQLAKEYRNSMFTEDEWHRANAQVEAFLEVKKFLEQ